MPRSCIDIATACIVSPASTRRAISCTSGPVTGSGSCRSSSPVCSSYTRRYPCGSRPCGRPFCAFNRTVRSCRSRIVSASASARRNSNPIENESSLRFRS